MNQKEYNRIYRQTHREQRREEKTRYRRKKGMLPRAERLALNRKFVSPEVVLAKQLRGCSLKRTEAFGSDVDRLRQKQYRIKNRSRMRTEARPGALLKFIKARSRVRGFFFRREDIAPYVEAGFDLGRCQVTGLPFEYEESWGPFCPSVDRIDSAIGYVPGNIRVVANVFNVAKNQYSDSDLWSVYECWIAKLRGDQLPRIKPFVMQKFSGEGWSAANRWHNLYSSARSATARKPHLLVDRDYIRHFVTDAINKDARCMLTGAPLVTDPNVRGRVFNKPSLRRLDKSKGWVDGNLQLCATCVTDGCHAWGPDPLWRMFTSWGKTINYALHEALIGDLI